MSWSFSVSGSSPADAMNKLREAVETDLHAPKDDRIEAAAEPLARKTKVGAATVAITSNGHLDADGTGYINIMVSCT